MPDVRRFAESPDEIREAADEILSKPIYRPAEPNIVQRAINWIVEQLADLFPSVGGPSAGPGSFVLGWFILGVLGIAAIYLLVRVMPRRLAKASTEVAEVETTITHRAGRNEWLDRANAAEAEGDWREVVRCRYRALVAGLVESNELPAEKGATSGEYLTAFEAEPPRGPAFADASGRFEEVWYGGSGADDDDASRLRDADDVVFGTGKSR